MSSNPNQTVVLEAVAALLKQTENGAVIVGSVVAPEAGRDALADLVAAQAQSFTLAVEAHLHMKFLEERLNSGDTLGLLSDLRSFLQAYSSVLPEVKTAVLIQRITSWFQDWDAVK